MKKHCISRFSAYIAAGLLCAPIRGKGRFAAQYPGVDAGDEPRSLHLRCGHDIGHALRIAGFRGQFHPLTDPYCMGPVTLSPPEQFRRPPALGIIPVTLFIYKIMIISD